MGSDVLQVVFVLAGWLAIQQNIFRNTVCSSQPVFLYNQIFRYGQVHSYMTESGDFTCPKSNEQLFIMPSVVGITAHLIYMN